MSFSITINADNLVNCLSSFNGNLHEAVVKFSEKDMCIFSATRKEDLVATSKTFIHASMKIKRDLFLDYNVTDYGSIYLLDMTLFMNAIKGEKCNNKILKISRSDEYPMIMTFKTTNEYDTVFGVENIPIKSTQNDFIDFEGELDDISWFSRTNFNNIVSKFSQRQHASLLLSINEQNICIKSPKAFESGDPNYLEYLILLDIEKKGDATGIENSDEVLKDCEFKRELSVSLLKEFTKTKMIYDFVGIHMSKDHPFTILSYNLMSNKTSATSCGKLNYYIGEHIIEFKEKTKRGRKAGTLKGE